MNPENFKVILNKGRVLGGNKVSESNFLKRVIQKHPIGFFAGMLPPTLYGLYSFIQTMTGNKEDLYNKFPIEEPTPFDIGTNATSVFDNYLNNR